MCLVTTQQERLARRNITCYKRVYTGLTGSNFISELKRFSYTPERLYSTKFKFSYFDCDVYDDKVSQKYFGKMPSGTSRYQYADKHKYKFITAGFHSASTIARLTIDDLNFYDNEVIVRCTIPRGSYYYRDSTGLCVSDQIIIHSDIVATSR